ncbi:MAG: adenylate/guanylate cyclase domain-containing protein [Burkholderiales bacterium]|nr:adenylate/guanylate cyclase domain-containing protein [Burkholderiales bacterium]
MTRRTWSARTLARRARRFAQVAAATAACVLTAQFQGALDVLDDFYYDAWHHLAGKRREAGHVAIASVDDDTFLKLKDDPLAFWQPHFARAMAVLEDAGARVIGLDFVYATSAETWLKRLDLPDTEISRTYDSAFRERLAAGGKILVGHLIENSRGASELVLPPPEHYFLLPGQLQDVGLANLFPDRDSIVRRFYPVLVTQPGVPGIGFSTQLALRAAGQDPGASVWEVGGAALPRSVAARTIGYVGPPNSIPRVSMARLLEPGAAALPEVRALKGRVVIITAHDSSSLQDTHLTPYSRGLVGFARTQMTGGEVHANIVETLLSGRYPRAPHAGAVAAAIGAFALLAAALFLRLHPLTGAACGAAAALLAAGAGYVAFRADWIAPVAALQACLLLGFLLTIGLRLTGEERARRRLRTMFGSYVSAEVVDLLLARQSGGDAVDLRGEEMTVTVLFSDIRNFTTLSEKLSAHEVVEMLNTYFARVCEPILAERGNVNKYIGDAVMAMFGAPVSYPDHARRAVRAALGMLAAADDFKSWMAQRFGDRDLPEFAIGIGLHTGVVVSGDIGTEKRREYTIIGDTVNTASRLEGMTKALGWRIVASRATLEAAGPGVAAGRRDSVAVKGRTGSVDVVEILGVREIV